MSYDLEILIDGGEKTPSMIIEKNSGLSHESAFS